MELKGGMIDSQKAVRDFSLWCGSKKRNETAVSFMNRSSFHILWRMRIWIKRETLFIHTQSEFPIVLTHTYSITLHTRTQHENPHFGKDFPAPHDFYWHILLCILIYQHCIRIMDSTRSRMPGYRWNRKKNSMEWLVWSEPLHSIYAIWNEKLHRSCWFIALAYILGERYSTVWLYGVSFTTIIQVV